jgi:hypothetical protein
MFHSEGIDPSKAQIFIQVLPIGTLTGRTQVPPYSCTQVTTYREIGEDT